MDRAGDGNPVLEVKNMSKSFGKVQALKNVDMDVYAGDVVGLLGDNGAGKSTLIKIISGNYRADGGEVYLNGEKLDCRSPAEARSTGIETVYQNSPVCENATVTANFFIGRELHGGIPGMRVLKDRAMQEETMQVLSDIGIEIPSVRAKMGLLSGGQRQAIILGRFFHWGGKVALLDEPFAALGVAESRNGLKLIRQVSERGHPIVLITHNIEYAFEVMNRFVVLRHGEVVGTGRREDVTVDDVIAMITGAIHLQN
jgi:D-xylose transport system ATP-binding protein